MKDFTKVIKEINRTMDFFMFFESFLNAAIFFLAVYFLLSLVNLYPISALIPALIYLILRLYVHSHEDKRKIVESKYEPLKEKLRTAADNVNEDNPIVNELEEEVVRDLKNVGLSSFVQTRKISYKIFASMLLSIAIVLATTMNLYIVDLSNFLSGIPELIDALNPRKIAGNMDVNISESNGIYGESKLALLGDNPVDIRIKPVNYEVNVREEGDAEKKQFDEIFPSEVGIEQSSSSDEHIPEEQQELVKMYFDKLAGR